MQQKNVRFAMGVALIIGIAGVVYYFTLNWFYAVVTFSVLFFFYINGEWFFAYCREKTLRFVPTVGSRTNSSIIEDDILRLPSTYDPGVNYVCFRPGGSSVAWAPFHGMRDIYILKDELIDREEGAIFAKGDWVVLKFTELPAEWQSLILLKYREDRWSPFDPNRHFIFYADTYTSRDPAEKTKNVFESQRAAKQEELINTYRSQIDSLQAVINSNVDMVKGFKSIYDTNEETKQKIKYSQGPGTEE